MSPSYAEVDTHPRLMAAEVAVACDRLRDGDDRPLTELVATVEPQDIARALTELETSRWLPALARLPREEAAEIYSHLPLELQAEALEALQPQTAVELVSELSYDDAAAVLNEVDDARSDAILDALPDDDSQVLENLLAYQEDTAGRIMTPEFVAVQKDWSVPDALDHLRAQCELAETINTVFVTTPDGVLTGWLRLKDLLLARPRQIVADLMRSDTISVNAAEDREEAIRLITHYDLDVLPVIDDAGRILGILTVDDMIDVAQAETTEDFQRLGAVGTMTSSLRDATVGLLYRKRIGWLAILVVVNVLSGAAIAHFEDAIETVVALVFFIPMVIATGGNAGTQASTLVIRALATGDIHLRDLGKLGGKELLVATALGLSMAAAIWVSGNLLADMQVANAIAIAMAIVVIWGSLFGLALPFGLTALKIDPAVASAPLVTSVIDITGILIYFSVAVLILGIQP